MSKRTGLWVKSLMAATAFTVYMVPGCNLSLDNPTLQALLGSPLASGILNGGPDFGAGSFDGGFDGGFDGSFDQGHDPSFDGGLDNESPDGMDDHPNDGPDSEANAG